MDKAKGSILKRLTERYLIQGLSGMASGLFCTLIIGLIIKQIGSLAGDTVVGQVLVGIGGIASVLTGVGIAIGTGHQLGASKLVLYASAINGMIGAYALGFINGSVFVEGSVVLTGPGDPLGAFIATVIGVEVGSRIAGKTKLDILITPAVTILVGSSVALAIGPSLSAFTQMLGGFISQATELQPFLMGIIISVLMGIFLTLPISSAAIGLILGLSGLSAGAATAGCAAQMVGFAVMSYKENGMNGLLAQGLGTSMLQIPNIVKNPKVWLPPILASAITGPIATMVFKLENIPAGSGMGTSGLVGPILTWQSMVGTQSNLNLAIGIGMVYFILPAVLTLLFAQILRKIGWIKPNDLKLEL